MSAEESLETYSDEALAGAIEQLKRADYLGSWGKNRLIALRAEERRRRHNRRDSSKL